MLKELLWSFSIFFQVSLIYLPAISWRTPTLPPWSNNQQLSFTINADFFKTTVQPIWTAFGISSTSWEMTLGIPATVTCQSCDSYHCAKCMRANGAKATIWHNKWCQIKCRYAWSWSISLEFEKNLYDYHLIFIHYDPFNFAYSFPRAIPPNVPRKCFMPS